MSDKTRISMGNVEPMMLRYRSRSRTARVPVGALLLLVAAACQDVGPSAPSDIVEETSPMRVSVSGQVLPESQMQAIQRRLARDVALALASPPLRALVHEAIQESPFREGKLHFRTFLQEEGAPLLRSLANLRQTAEADVFRSLDNLLDLEFYMPVPDHRAAWNGGTNLIVAAALRDHVIPVAFDLIGQEVTIASAEIAPETPALVLVPVETDFSRVPPPETDFSRVPPPSEVAIGTASHVPGVYMTEARIGDDHEGWPNGTPEFEVHVFRRDANGTYVDISCSGEARTGHYYWDYDDVNQVWTGKVLLISEEGLGATKVEYHMWEDDSGKCDDSGGGRPPRTSSQWIELIDDWVAVGQAVYEVFDSTTELKEVWAAVRALADGIILLDRADEDEFVGVILGPRGTDKCWVHETGPEWFPIMRTENSISAQGGVWLDYTFGKREPMCPPPEPSQMSVTINGPTTAQPYTTVTVNALVDGSSATPFSYEWKVDNAPKSNCPTHQDWCSHTLGGDGTSTYFWLKVTDTKGDAASDDHLVFARW